MSKFVIFMISLIIIMIGFGVPAVSIYLSVMYNFNFIASSVISVMALIGAGILGLTAFSMGLFADYSTKLKSSTVDKLNLFRAHQRATLEELDDIISVLEEIKKLLTEASDVE